MIHEGCEQRSPTPFVRMPVDDQHPARHPNFLIKIRVQQGVQEPPNPSISSQVLDYFQSSNDEGAR